MEEPNVPKCQSKAKSDGISVCTVSKEDQSSKFQDNPGSFTVSISSWYSTNFFSLSFSLILVLFSYLCLTLNIVFITLPLPELNTWGKKKKILPGILQAEVIICQFIQLSECLSVSVVILVYVVLTVMTKKPSRGNLMGRTLTVYL